MHVSWSRVLAFGGLAAVGVGVWIAVASAPGTPSSGVAGAEATQVTHTVRVGGVDVAVTAKPSGSVCFSAPHVSGCTTSLPTGRLGYATGLDGGRVVLAGVAGTGVRAVIARLTRGGVVWPELRAGAFYAELPAGYRLRTIVKVLAGGRRVAFKA